MSEFSPAQLPELKALHGQYCVVEPLAQSHAADLYRAISGPLQDQRHQYLYGTAPSSEQSLSDWIENANSDPESQFYAVIDRQTGVCGGRQAFMRMRPEHGSIEVGAVLWGQGVARTRIATEALFLTACYVFDDLNYRRFEWKCNNLNEASKASARRFGFKPEGVFRQDMIVKGENRDTAWFSILDHEWPNLKAQYQNWLEPENFDANAQALTKLAISRA